MTRAVASFAAGALAGAVALAGLTTAGHGASSSGPAQLTGADWKGFGSREREAFLNGFLNGVAAGQLPAPDTTPSRGIAALRAGQQLRFPYAANVYSVQLDDYYFYADRLATPVIDVLARVNQQMLQPQR